MHKHGALHVSDMNSRSSIGVFLAEHGLRRRAARAREPRAETRRPPSRPCRPSRSGRVGGVRASMGAEERVAAVAVGLGAGLALSRCCTRALMRSAASSASSGATPSPLLVILYEISQSVHSRCGWQVVPPVWHWRWTRSALWYRTGSAARCSVLAAVCSAARLLFSKIYSM